MNRVVLPRDYSSSEITPVYIFWTSTRSDMITHNCIPNNFVAVVPIDDLENDDEEHVEFQHEESTYHVKDTIKTERRLKQISIYM